MKRVQQDLSKEIDQSVEKETKVRGKWGRHNHTIATI